MYYRGMGVTQDYGEAQQWSRKAADQGYAPADYAIGFLYFEGRGVPQDYGEALRWYRIAADKGEARAQYSIGYIFHHGQGVQRDDGEALEWFRKAAEQGNKLAQYELGYMYQKGYGAAQNYQEAAAWYRKAAAQGNAQAESGIGYLMYYGYGVPQDHAEANRWFRKAADQGEAYALEELSEKLTLAREFSLGIKIFIGILLAFNSFSFNYWEAGKSLRDSHQKLNAGLGILCLVSGGLGWYGYTHHLIRCLSCGFNAFTWIKWLLDGILVASFVYFLWVEKREKAGLPEGQVLRGD